MITDRPAYTVKRGDTSPAVRASLLQGNGRPIDLTGATVAFFMRPARGQRDGGTVLASARIVEPQRGKVAYDWKDGDTDTPGLFRAEFQVTFADGSRQTIPSDGYIDVDVLGDLG